MARNILAVLFLILCLSAGALIYLGTTHPAQADEYYLPTIIVPSSDNSQGLIANQDVVSVQEFIVEATVTPTSIQAVIVDEHLSNAFQEMNNFWAASTQVIPTAVYETETVQPVGNVDLVITLPTDIPTQTMEVSESPAPTATFYPGITPLNCENGVCPLVVAETSHKTCDLILQIPTNVEQLYDMMVKNDGRLCWYNFAPMCGELQNPYIDWALIQLMTYPEDGDDQSVMAYTKTLKEISSLRGIYLNLDDNSTIKIEESTIFQMLLESAAAGETCSDMDGRPIIKKVDRFITELNSFVVPK